MKFSIGNIGKFLAFQVAQPLQLKQNATHLDLGAGAIPRNPLNADVLVATDIQESFEEAYGLSRIACDLTEKLPFSDNTFDSVSAFDVLEHIPRWERFNGKVQYPFINLMNEISRILVPGGYFIAVTPAYPHPASFQDPTHINFISKETLNYFVSPNPGAHSLGYGFNGSFELIFNALLRGPGPYESNSWLNLDIRSHTIELNTKHLAKLLVRIGLLTRRRNPSHLLWVIRKPKN